ncbi:MAG: SEC-C metal-binding domain-containing protein [Candidatus Aenigmatarchaeota archaeon]
MTMSDSMDFDKRKSKTPEEQEAKLRKTLIEEGMDEEKIEQSVKIFHGDEEELKKLIDSMKSQGIDVDREKLKNYPAFMPTVENIAKMFNDVWFNGDWQRHIEWTETYGTEEQKKKDIPLIKKLMKTEKIEGLFIVKDFNEDKTWLIYPDTNEEIIVDEGLGVDHDEFLKMKNAKIPPKLYCIINKIDGKNSFETANFTNMENMGEIKEVLGNYNLIENSEHEKLHDTRLKSKIAKIGRNDLCPCGSGKKYKKCCLKL